MEWWKKCVGYQCYIRSFKDGNGDGIGDIKGIVEKLDYLHELGINLLWINPFFKSSGVDNGYDVVDYYSIEKEYGSKKDLKRLIEKAHSYGIKVVFDLVLNHTSYKHKWFIKSCKSKKSKYSDYYIWTDPIYVEGKRQVPCNWQSIFGGSCFEWNEKRGQYYFKTFSKEQPDLNYKNKAVLQDMEKIIKYWLDFGADGYRIDAVSHIGKAEFKNAEPESQELVNDISKFSNLPLVDDVLKDINEKVIIPNNAVTIGELGGNSSIDRQFEYVKQKDNKMSMILTFDHVNCLKNGKLDIAKLKKNLFAWQEKIENDGWIALFWLNHDYPRLVNFYGDVNYNKESSSALAAAMYFLKGTPFIYNGEEIGMTNYSFTKIEDFSDLRTKLRYQLEKNQAVKEEILQEEIKNSRDNSRTLMQWTDEDNAGFTKGKPNFFINPNYKEINVKAQLKDKNSLLSKYKEIIKLRKDHIDLFTQGKVVQMFEKNNKLIAYKRVLNKKEFLIISNLTKEKLKIEKSFEIKRVLFNNYNSYNEREKNINLESYQALVLQIK